MGTNQQVLDRLRNTIIQQIGQCDGKFMPFVCAMAKTEKGLNTIVQYISN